MLNEKGKELKDYCVVFYYLDTEMSMPNEIQGMLYAVL